MPTPSECEIITSRLNQMSDESEKRHDHTTREVVSMRKEFKEHIEDEKQMHSEHMEVQRANTVALTELATTLSSQVKNTKPLVDAVSAGRTLGSIGKWLSSIAIIGVGLVWLWDVLTKVPPAT